MAFIVFAVLVLLFILVSIFVLARWLWLKGIYGRLLLVLGFIGINYSIYDAIYPSESFYTSELQRLVKVSVPSDALFLYKTATYPDIHGDYSACFIVRLSQASFEKLQTSISLDPAQETKSSGCANMDKLLKPLNAMASQYTLSKLATREDAEIFIELIPNHNLAVISWYLW